MWWEWAGSSGWSWKQSRNKLESNWKQTGVSQKVNELWQNPSQDAWWQTPKRTSVEDKTSQYQKTWNSSTSNTYTITWLLTWLMVDTKNHLTTPSVLIGETREYDARKATNNTVRTVQIQNDQIRTALYRPLLLKFQVINKHLRQFAYKTFTHTKQGRCD
jgi:hypothetical protein